MKKLILLLTATIFVACEDNGMSAPTEVCYDKKLDIKKFLLIIPNIQMNGKKELARLNMVLIVRCGMFITLSQFVTVLKMWNFTN